MGYNHPMPLRIVIAPQAFKQSIAARAAAIAIQRGVLQAVPDAETVLIPVADGGDGTLAALIDTTDGQYFATPVTGPLGDDITAQWGVMGDGQTAVIEMALASGLALIPDDRRNPRVATTYGTGQLIAAALEAGYTRIIVGLGGSATNDGGTGMASALGVRFLDAAGHELPPGGGALASLARIDTSGVHPSLAAATLIGATDVTNPLCGDTGASAIFGPQKGATTTMVAELDACLSNLARVIQTDLDIDVLDNPGSGAAGGLGAGLIAFAGFDKAPVGIARRSKALGVPTLLLAGSLGPGYEALYEHGIDAIVPIAEEPTTLESSLQHGAGLLERGAERAIRLYHLGRSQP